MAQELSASQVNAVLKEKASGLDGADTIGAELATMMAEQAAEAGPEKPLKPVRLEPPAQGSFRFRTKPGLGLTSIRLRVFLPNPRYNDDQNRQYKNNWERNSERVWGKPDRYGKPTMKWREVLEPDKRLWERLGIETIEFRRIPGTQEASFQTRDPELAAYVRMRITEPDLSMIYEEVGPTMAQLASGEWVEVLPATDAARQQMAAAAAGV